MNRNRNQQVHLYVNGKYDHTIQEGNVPEYTKKFNKKKRASKYDRRYF